MQIATAYNSQTKRISNKLGMRLQFATAYPLPLITKTNMELTLIQTRIHEVRGQKVMLDFDLAELYEVLTKKGKNLGSLKYDLFLIKNVY